jgi:hypothetical protein
MPKGLGDGTHAPLPRCEDIMPAFKLQGRTAVAVSVCLVKAFRKLPSICI